MRGIEWKKEQRKKLSTNKDNYSNSDSKEKRRLICRNFVFCVGEKSLFCHFDAFLIYVEIIISFTKVEILNSSTIPSANFPCILINLSISSCIMSIIQSAICSCFTCVFGYFRMFGSLKRNRIQKRT